MSFGHAITGTAFVLIFCSQHSLEKFSMSFVDRSQFNLFPNRTSIKIRNVSTTKNIDFYPHILDAFFTTKVFMSEEFNKNFI